MRKIIIFLIMVLFICSFFVKTDQEIRVRIIPNSDSEEDLIIKENIKSFTICYLKKAYDEEYDIFIQNINSSLNEFEKSLENEFKTSIQVSFDYHTLYNKTYNNSAVKNTKELTLYIVIEEGKGSNWWGTVYPDFLEINSSEEYKYESLIAYIFNKIKEN